ncbi:MAG: preprotein translocase subunit YajC [Coxiella sp. RIFCSPHIGHO2_12_FULL_44_14]|nr:MAG: preprotein translocase subunit YajC [Coxiella sp. RIFCSPHIGHO2_12_FULL_44_14]
MAWLNLLGISVAEAATADAGHAALQHPQASFWNMIWLPLLLIVVFYFLLIRPQSKRTKEHRSLLERLSIGDEVISTGGIVAKVIRLKDNFVTLEVAKGVEITLQKSSIAQVLPKGTIDSIH